MKSAEFRAIVIVFLLSVAQLSVASDTSMEIEYLLEAIGQSECIFIRNGKEYSAHDAEVHLRNKYAKAKIWVKNGQQFIDRLASSSYLSGKPYLFRCNNSEPQSTKLWMSELLDNYARPQGG